MAFDDATLQTFNKFLDVLLSVFTAKPNTAVASAWKQVSQWLGLGQLEGPYEVLEHECQLELCTPDGRDALYSKNQRVRFRQDHVIAYSDEAWGEGDIFAEYRCSPGVAVDRYREGHRHHVLISLRKTMNRGDEQEISIQRRIRNGFTKSVEDLQVEVNHQTRKMTISLIFPRERLPKRCWLVEENARRTHALGAEHFTPLPDKRLRVKWQVDHPRLFEAYILMWEW